MIALLAGLTALGPFSMHVIAPSLPATASALSVSADAAQLLISLSVLCVAFGAIVYGPLADHFGRRPILLGGLAFAVVGGAAASFAPSFEWALAGRFVQAIGAGAGLVLARAVARDVFGAAGAAPAIAAFTAAMVVAPMLGPSIGGLLYAGLGWRGPFGAIALLAAVLGVWVWTAYRETLAHPTPRLDFASVRADYLRIAHSRAFWAYAAHAGLSLAVFFVFVGGAPHVMADAFGWTPAGYGALFVGVSVCYLIGNLLNAPISRALGFDGAIRWGSVLAMMGALGAAAAFALGADHPAVLIAGAAANSFGAGFSQANSLAGCVNAAPDRAGSAAGLGSVVQFGVGAVAAQAAALLPSTQTTALPLAMAATAALSLIVFMALRAGAPRGR